MRAWPAWLLMGGCVVLVVPLTFVLEGLLSGLAVGLGIALLMSERRSCWPGLPPDPVSGNVVTLFGGSSSVLGMPSFITLAGAADHTGAVDAVVQMVCFVKGTRIATPVGEAAVEKLAVGGLVLTASGAQCGRCAGSAWAKC